MSHPLPSLDPTPEQLAHGHSVMAEILRHVAESRVIALPPYDPARDAQPSEVALLSVARTSNAFGGSLGDYGYQFEGEEDLLHLFVCRMDGGALSVAEGQRVFAHLMPGVPPGLVWLRPGATSQHFYFGHDVLLETSSSSNDLNL